MMRSVVEVRIYDSHLDCAIKLTCVYTFPPKNPYHHQNSQKNRKNEARKMENLKI
jgi:hypothetical protein